MTPNFLVLLGTAFIPFLLAYIWFHDSVFGGKRWHAMADMSTEKTASPVKPMKLLLSLLLNALLAFGIYNFSIHEVGVFGMVGADADLMKTGSAATFLAEYGGKFHTFSHGLAHGFAATLLYALPILGYVVIFEKKSSTYFWVYLGYWFISITLMSIVICLWGAVPV